MKFKNWLDIWLEKYVKHSVKPRTYINYGGMIEKHIKPKLGDYELEELSPLVLQNFMLEEIANLKLKTLPSGAITVEKTVSKMNKDRFSCLAYCIFYILEYTNNIQEPVNEMQLLSEYTYL